MRRSALSLAVCLPLYGCQPSLGECDEEAARELVFDQCGAPAYAGQALMQISCGNGNYCHSAGATGDVRFGAPQGLNWDVPLASTTGALDPEGFLDVLRRGQANIHRERDLVWAMVEAEVMPPFGGATIEPLDTGRLYRFEDGRDLSRVDLEEGRDQLRNWLACGSPVVERTFPIREPAEMPTEVGSVVPLGATNIRVMPTFDSIYSQILGVRCARCHRPSSAYFRENELDMSSADTAFASLVGVEAMAGTSRRDGNPPCGASRSTRVVPGDPDASLLYLKVSRTPACGARMPLNNDPLCAQEIEVIRQWIADGAAR